jgi:hypothetical protein
MTGGRALQQFCRPDSVEPLSPRQAVRRVVGALATSLGFVLCTALMECWDADCEPGTALVLP